MLMLDGVYEPVAARPDKSRLRRARAPTSAQLTHLTGKIAHRAISEKRLSLSPQARVR